MHPNLEKHCWCTTHHPMVAQTLGQVSSIQDYVDQGVEVKFKWIEVLDESPKLTRAVRSTSAQVCLGAKCSPGWPSAKCSEGRLLLAPWDVQIGHVC